MGLLNAGNPQGEVLATWRAKELALEFVQRLDNDLQDPGLSKRLAVSDACCFVGNTRIAAWHELHVSNGPTEAVDTLIERVKRVAFRFQSFRNYRIPQISEVPRTQSGRYSDSRTSTVSRFTAPPSLTRAALYISEIYGSIIFVRYKPSRPTGASPSVR